MYFRVNMRPAPDAVWLEGEGRLGDKTVIMGPPRSGKTTFMKLLFALLTPYGREFVDVAKDDTAEYLLEDGGKIELTVGEFRLRCGRPLEGGEVGCERDDAPRREDVFLLYEGFELTLKHGLAPSVFQNMRDRMDSLVEKQRSGKYAISKSGGKWYEVLGHRLIPFSNVSNAVAVVGYLERLAQAEGYWILIDGLLDGLHPEESMYVAARLLASRARVVVTTHSPWVKDLFLCAKATLEAAGVKGDPGTVVVYEIDKQFVQVEFTSYGKIYEKLYAKC